MAVARCEECGRPSGTKHTYTHAHKPLFPPSGDMICAERKCIRLVSLIWLTDEEEQRYLRGERVFRLPGHVGGVRVT